jgi:molybdate-binding protein
MDNELTAEDINVLRDYIKTESGRKFLLKLASREIDLMSEAGNSKTTLERQGQLVNRFAGLHEVRALIDDYVNKK